jgi:Tol biopolymer transport system component
MSDQLRLERTLPALLEDLYLGPTPDYRNEVLAAVRRTRQRPAWTFLERWFPVTDIATRPAFAPRVPFRLLFAVALLVLALAVAVAAYFGSQRRLPPPFGPAANGLIVYSMNGDLFAGDAVTGAASLLIGGPEVDGQPVVSPDGTKVGFLSAPTGSTSDSFDLSVAGIDGQGRKVIATGVSTDDRWIWSPDGTYLLHNVDRDGRLLRYELAGGPPVQIAAVALLQADAFQPPKGDQILYEGPGTGRTLWVMNVDGTGARMIYEIPTAELRDGCDFGGVRWSPDGTRIAFLRAPAAGGDGCRIFVMNADGSAPHQLTTTAGAWTETDFRWSPDSAQIAFDRWEYLEGSGQWMIHPLGVVSAEGGEVRSVGPTPVSDGAAFEWSPDGTTIVSLAGSVLAWPPSSTAVEAQPVLIDVATGEHRNAAWSAASWPTWQRRAP